MTKEHAYAYEAGYVDGSTHYELEHCPACKNVADLQATLDENAKLRELVRDMWRYRDALSYGAAIPTLKRMCELGIEVDDVLRTE